MSVDAGDRWFVRSGSENPRLRLLCFPFAGGSATSFSKWPEFLPDDIEVCAVQLPGRQKRISEPTYRRVSEAADSLVTALEPLLSAPVAMFGDCTGSFLAFEACRLLRRQGESEPLHFFATCCRAPQLPYRHRLIHTLHEVEFKEKMRELGVVPEWLMQSDRALADFLPLLRADFEMAETYAYTDEPRFNFPITVFSGTEDAFNSREEVGAWKEQTSEELEMHEFEAKHSLTVTHSGVLLTKVARQLDSIASVRRGVGSA